MSNPYSENHTMQMLGKNYYSAVFANGGYEAMNDVIKARPFTCTFETAMDVFAIGYIYGKRAERAKKKH